MEAHEAFKAVRLYNELVQMKNNAINALDYRSASLIKSIIDGREIEEFEIEERQQALWKYSFNRYAPVYAKLSEARAKGLDARYIETSNYESFYKENAITASSGRPVIGFNPMEDMLIDYAEYGEVSGAHMDDISKVLILDTSGDEDVIVEVITVNKYT